MKKLRVERPDGQTLVVRELCAGDVQALQQYHAGLSPETRAVFTPHAYDDATVARMIARAVDGTDLACVALAGREIVAYFFLWNMVDPVPSLGIGITDRYQHKGLGVQFMKMLIAGASAAKRDGVELTTVLTNARAFALYLKVGFQYVEDVDNIAGDGRVMRERWMFLPLKPGAKPIRREHRPPV